MAPGEEAQVPHVTRCLEGTVGPVVAATDFMRGFAEQIRAFVPRRYVVLGTDGFGRSDTREQLRRFFEVDRRTVTLAALKALADEGVIPAEMVAEARSRYDLPRSGEPPWTQ
jgi:pyruvate dehydrogenase E1 component